MGDLPVWLQVLGMAATAIATGVGMYLGIRRDLDRTAVRVDMLEREVFGQVPRVPSPRRRFSDREQDFA